MVIHDTVYLPVGSVYVKSSGGPGGHRALKAVLEEYGYDSFSRVSVGVGPVDAVRIIFIIQ